MRMYKVESSNITAVGYDEDKLELRVTFVGGKTYSYSQVPAGRAERIMFPGAKYGHSSGKAFNDVVKTAGYAYCEVTSVGQGVLTSESETTVPEAFR